MRAPSGDLTMNSRSRTRITSWSTRSREARESVVSDAAVWKVHGQKIDRSKDVILHALYPLPFRIRVFRIPLLLVLRSWVSFLIK